MNPNVAWAKRMLISGYAKTNFNNMDNPVGCLSALNDLVATGSVPDSRYGFFWNFRKNYVRWCERNDEEIDAMPDGLAEQLDAWKRRDVTIGRQVTVVAPALINRRTDPMTLKEQWAFHCAYLAGRKADLWTKGSRKILRQRRFTFELDDSLQIEDVGFTDKKSNDLTRLYIHDASRLPAVVLWNDRREKGEYGSVGFSTCNHVVKGATPQGPCMLGVSVTLIDDDHACVDVHYRSVELYKKFVADLVFMRDTLLAPFDLSGMEVEVTCHFDNITLHPSYWVCVLAHLDAPVDTMETVREKDPKFHRLAAKLTGEYLLPERGTSIANHEQSLRVKEWALTAFDAMTLRKLQEYLRANGSDSGS